MSPEMTWFDPALLSTAFLAGLLGSGHCFGMCGGIAAGLGAMSKGRAVVPALQFNLARLASYAVLGLVAAAILSSVTAWAPIGHWLRLFTALMILLIGLKFLFNFRGIEFIEKGGAGIWKKILPFALKASNRQDAIGRLLLGACWGFIPCGLVYTVLMSAASTANPASGAVTMLAFGGGTLPSMLGLTVAAPALSTFLEDQTVRKVIGFALIILALWTIAMMWAGLHGQPTNHAHH